MFIYTPDFFPSKIVLIGAGGTGSRLMPMLAQLVKTCMRQYNPTAWLDTLPIYVVDGDIVEEKNLLRQNFIAKDVGKPKAAVLANRYSNAFGIPIHSCSRFLKYGDSIVTDEDPNTYISSNYTVYILAVDSAEARRILLHNIYNGFFAESNIDYRSNKAFIIDAGNEDAFGQVKFFTPRILERDETYYPTSYVYNIQNDVASAISYRHLYKDYIKYYPNNSHIEVKTDFIPIDLDYYINLGSSAQELSCAELPQTLAINSMMATLICSVLQNFLYLKPMNYDGIRFALNGSIATEYNRPKRWLRRVNGPITEVKNKTGKFLEGLTLHNSIRKMDSSSDEFNLFEKLRLDLIRSMEKSGMILNSEGEFISRPIPKPIVTEEEIAKDTVIAELKEAVKNLKNQLSTENSTISSSAASIPTLVSIPHTSIERELGIIERPQAISPAPAVPTPTPEVSVAVPAPRRTRARRTSPVVVDQPVTTNYDDDIDF